MDAEKLMSFGGYPGVSLVDAIEQHAVARKLLAGGVDPMEKRKAEKVAIATADARSFRTVALMWLDHWKADKSGRHVGTTSRRLDANVFPRLGARPIAEIEAPELVAMAKAIEARGVGDLARRSLETSGQIFRYAVAHGYCKRNPAADLRPGTF